MEKENRKVELSPLAKSIGFTADMITSFSDCAKDENVVRFSFVDRYKDQIQKFVNLP